MGLKFGAAHQAQSPGQIVEHGGHGGMFATVLSGVALVFSGLSYYDSSLKTADLAVFVPPMIHYARDGDNDVFNVPITIANEGARTGTVLNMVLEVENLRPEAEKKTARFHSAFLGEYPRTDDAINRSFAPLSIAGHGTFTETVRFYPMDEPLPFLVDDKGEYRFTLKLTTAEPQNPDLIESLWHTEPKPLSFQLTLPFISFQHLAFRRGTIAMYNKDWRPAVSSSTEPAAKTRGLAPDGEQMAPLLPKAEVEPVPAPEAQPQPAPGAQPQPDPEAQPEAAPGTK
ncbi:MAG: hypothetical protein ABL894_09115, partial [Hyphomicrobium sp.]